MEREQFTFYASFAIALRRIRKAADRCAAYDAIVDYALYGQEPDPEKLPNVAAIAFELIRPNLRASRRKAMGKSGNCAEESGKTDGRLAEDNRNKKENKKEREKENERETEREKEHKYVSEESKEEFPPMRREGESYDAYSRRMRELRDSGYFERKRLS